MKHFLAVFVSLQSILSCSKDNGIEAKPITKSDVNFQIIVGSKTFIGTLYQTEAANAFKATLPFTVTMNEINGNEKYCQLPQPLPLSATKAGTIHNGDLMLYGSGTLVLFYKTFYSSYSYTRIGKLDNPSGLEAALGAGNVSVKFELIN